MAGVLLSLLALLAPDLTLAPINAGEPRIDGTTAAIDRPQRPVPAGSVWHLDLDAGPARGSSPALATPPAPVVDEAAFHAAIEAARVEGGAYGISFTAVRDGQVLWSGAVGTTRHSTPLGADDPLVIGSVTKTFVAAAVLQLVEEGRLRLDDSVRRHLPEQGLSREITIRQLLDHTSGLADLFNDTTRKGLEEHPEHPWTATEVLSALHAPWYRPGEGWAYANTNYYLLGLVVERITGATLSEEVQRRFLGPLGLRHTRVLTGAADEHGPLSPAWATIFWASGAMSASASDLAIWGDALYGDAVLTDASRAEMIALNSHDYGLGLQRIELPGAIGFGHTGLLNTYTSLLAHLPEQEVTLALLVNRSHVDLGAMLAAESAGGGPSLLELVGVEIPVPVPVPVPASAAAAGP